MLIKLPRYHNATISIALPHYKENLIYLPGRKSPLSACTDTNTTTRQPWSTKSHRTHSSATRSATRAEICREPPTEATNPTRCHCTTSSPPETSPDTPGSLSQASSSKPSKAWIRSSWLSTLELHHSLPEVLHTQQRNPKPRQEEQVGSGIAACNTFFFLLLPCP